MSTRLRRELEERNDPSHSAFMARLCPGIDPSDVLGIRSPVLKQYAKQLGPQEREAFLADLPHRYLEENILHAYLISRNRQYGQCLAETESFLPYINCWAVTDSLRPAVFKKHTAELEPVLQVWLKSDEPYTVRTAIGFYMAYYLEQAFRTEQAEQIADLRFDHYYVRMMAAWYMATALAKQWEAVLPILQENRMDSWSHNKTIQKAVESYRITPEQKELLRTMRRMG